MNPRKKRTKRELKKDLHFYLDFYYKVPEHLQMVFDKEIEEIIELLKLFGKKK